MIVNAAYWGVGLADKIPASGCHVDLVGEYKPTRFEFRRGDYWPKRKMMPSEHELK